jgi:hypothetical protein
VALIQEPGRENAWLAGHVALLLASYHHWLGRDLISDEGGPARAAERLYHVPFVVLSHDTAADPCFTYANLSAQRLFEMPWDEIVGLPSRFSAEAPARDERERLLRRVAEFGYIDDYRGVRVARSGRRFLIDRATVWNLVDASGAKVGQAASFAEWQPLDL